MKLKAKQSDFKNYNVIRFGYCQLQHLLQDSEPFAYTSGLYGWNADYYQLGDLIICTGYRSIGKAIQKAYTIATKYDNEARSIDSWSNDAKAQRAKLLEAFKNEILALL
jgi:hypothetical protein